MSSTYSERYYEDVGVGRSRFINAFVHFVNPVGQVPATSLLCTMKENRRWLVWEMKVHHILFWASYFIFWTLIYRNSYPSLLPLAIVVLIYMVFHAITFYTTAYYFFPRFLYTRKFGKFIGYTALLFITASAGLSVSLYLFMRPYLPADLKNVTEYIIAGAFSSNIFFPGAMCAVKLVVDRMRLDQDRKQMEKFHLESELQYLKAQVNPHFLFNAINSVYFLIKRDQEKASETLIRLSDLLRFQLYDCSVDKIDIRKEIEYLQNFVALEKIRKGEKVRVNFDAGDDLGGFSIAPFMLIPFLENAFKFVSNHKDEPNVINVSLKREGDSFNACFYNTHDNEHKDAVGGIGLKNVARRLELLYPKKHTLRLDKQPDSYTAILTLTLHD